MISVGIVGIPTYARLCRASVLGERARDYVVAAEALGASHARILLRAILPNILSPLIVQVTLGFASAIRDAAGLSFLGLGAQPPAIEWGLMLKSGRELVWVAWWVVTFPGSFILAAVLGFNLLGDGLRDLLDPRLRSREAASGRRPPGDRKLA
jgi:ABC-type dipeptide/oligopeptide/nickel transport system permease subunit